MSENIKNQPHWRCRLCGFSSPLSASFCGNPSCGADLAIYGEAVNPGEEENRSRERSASPPPEPSRPEPAEDKRRAAEEARKRAAEEKRRTAEAVRQQEEKAQKKARKKTASRQEKKGGKPKGLVAVVVCLILVLGLGGGLAAVHFLPDFDLPFVLPGEDSSSSGSPERDRDRRPKPDKSEDEPGDKSEPPKPVEQYDWRKNVLMADPFDAKTSWEEATEYPAFGTTIPRNLTPIPRKEIGSVTFVDSLDDPAMKAVRWDVSEAQDRSVMISCDYNSSTGKYDLCIGANGGVMAPADCSGMFFGYINVEHINFGDAFHTENTQTLEKMFCQCNSLKELDLSGFNTANVTSMRIMLSKCYNLAKLDINSFDTAKVEDMFGMFNSCSSLTELDVRSFDTSNVNDMSLMFENCSGLSKLDVTGFHTEKVTDMSRMFNGCSGLAELDISNFRTGNVTLMDSMLDGVRDDFVLHYSSANFDTSNVTSYENFMPDSFDWEKMFN